MKPIQEEVDTLLSGCIVNEGDPTVQWLRLLTRRVAALEDNEPAAQLEKLFKEGIK